MPARRLHVEEIEARVTPVAFVPDPSFGTTGVTPLPAGVTASAVTAELPGGGVAVAGTVWGNATGRDVAIVRLATDGTIDDGFGAGGVVTLDSGLTAADGAGAYEHSPRIVPLADGRLVVVAGFLVSSSNGSDYVSGVVAFRLLPDGSPDPTFGAGGRLVLPDVTELQAVLPDGGLVGVFGTNVLGPGTPTYYTPVTDDLFVEAVRYTAAGRPDPTFDGDGRAKLALGSVVLHSDILTDVTIGPVAVGADGAITFVLGDYDFDVNPYGHEASQRLSFREAVRLTADGVPDAGFGDGGKRPLTATQGTPNFTFIPLTILPGGSVVVELKRIQGGYMHQIDRSPNSALVRFAPDGTADPSFGDAGAVVGTGFDLAGTGGFTTSDPGVQADYTADGVLVARYDADHPAYDPAVAGGRYPQQVVPPDGRRYLLSGYGTVPILVVRLMPAPPVVPPAPPVVPAAPPVVPPPPVAPPRASAAGGRVTVSRADAADVVVTPFPDFAGDLRAAAGVGMVAAGTGPGGPGRVAFLDPVTGGTVRTVAPFEDGFTAGVFVTVADLTGDGVADVVVTPGAGGGPRVRAYDGATGTPLADFFGIDDAGFRGGVAVAVADVNGDGTPDVAVAATSGGGPRVAIYDGKSLTGTPTRLAADFFAFDPGLRAGLTLAAADFDSDGFADLVAAPGDGGGPAVVAFRGNALAAGRVEPLAAFVQGDAASRGGAAVAARDIDGDGSPDLVVAAGGRVRGYRGADVAFGDNPTASFDMTPAEAAAAGVAAP